MRTTVGLSSAAKNPTPPQPGEFAGFPRRTLLEVGDLPIEEIAALALREGQCTNPLYRVHRWFARRLGSQFRAVLTALTLRPGEADRFWDRYFSAIPLDNAVVFDPFVGGGTSVIEASRCNARVVGYDIDPVATSITRFELESPSWDRLPVTAESATEGVSARITPLHRTKLPGGAEADVLHHFWVEVAACEGCGEVCEVHPHHLLAYDAAKKRQWSFCRSCHEVAEQPFGTKHLACPCGSRTTIHEGNLVNGNLRCPECNASQPLVAADGKGKPPHRWKLFAQEYLDPESNGKSRLFKRATEADCELYREAEKLLAEFECSEGVFAPERSIPVVGRSDRRPLIHGFRRYRDLFNARQLLHLSLLGKEVSAVEDERCKRLLGLAYSEHLTTNNMYVGYAFGYRRVSPLFSIHSFRHIVRPVELNPWMSGVGRGTFPNVLNKIRRAVAFAKSPTDLDPGGGRRAGSRQVGPIDGVVGRYARDVLLGRTRAAIRTHNSADLSGFGDGTVDLVLTDPPYFDNLSYSELSDFYLAWHQKIGLAEGAYALPHRSAPIRANLALKGKSDAAVAEYRRRLGSIFRECWRVLRAEGVCVFTFHHRSVEAWVALGESVARSGFRVSAVLPLRGEGQGGLHSYEGTIKWDAVFVCRKGDQPPDDATEVVVPRHAARSAATKTRKYWTRLAAKKEVGFRPPDRLNLYRAYIAAAARVGHVRPGTLSLTAALALPFEG